MEENNFIILSRCKNGRIYKCQSCDKLYIEYKNFYFSFDDEEYRVFKRFFMSFNNEFPDDKVGDRRFKVSVGHPNLIALFNSKEIDELKSLLEGYGNRQNKFIILSPNSISHQFSDN